MNKAIPLLPYLGLHGVFQGELTSIAGRQNSVTFQVNHRNTVPTATSNDCIKISGTVALFLCKVNIRCRIFCLPGCYPKISRSRYILPVVLYGCEIWSLTLREERKLRVFENMVLRRIFVPKRDEVTGEWRRLHNEELNDFYCSPDIVRVIKSRRMRWTGHVARIGEERGVYRVLVGKPEGRRQLGRPRR